MDEAELDYKEALKSLIEVNTKKEKQREDLIASFGNADVYCNKMHNEVGVELFDRITKIADEISDKEVLVDKIMLRSFIDNEINYINDLLQSKTFDLVKAAYILTREEFAEGSINDDLTLRKMCLIERSINDYLVLDCKMLSVYQNLPTVLQTRLDDEKIDKKTLLKAVKTVINKGLGISSKRVRRENALKDIEVKIYDLNQPSKTK